MEMSESGIIGLELMNKDESIMVESDEEIELIAKALSSKTRRRILTMVQREPMDVSKIASLMNQTEANISAQVKKLHKANLITCDYSSGRHGVRKISKLKYNRLVLKF
ncbi:MAG: helix-turn-helix domain-containing protein [Promethearchaeia archaeon]